MNTKQLSWSDRNGHWQVHALTESGVKAVDKATETLVVAHAAYNTAKREHQGAQVAVANLADQARAAALEAGRIGDKPDKKALKKKRAAAIDRAEDAELDWLTAESRLAAVREEYLGVLAHHAPALAAVSRDTADAGVLELASALGIARKAETKVTQALSVLAALPQVVGGDDFRPVPPKPRKTTADEFGDAGSPSVHAQQAVESLTKAIGWAQRILDDLAADEKARAAQAKLDAETEAAPDLDDDDEEGDDDEVPYSDEDDD
jgi:hypothetical protein